MESYLQQDEFDAKILREVSTLVKKNFKNAETRSSENLQGELDKIFFRTLRTHKVIADISETTGIKGEIVELLLRGCLRYAYREYDNDVKQIGKQNTRLRSWLRQAQQKNQPHEEMPKKVIDREFEEPIKNQSEQRKKEQTKKKKKRGKEAIKEIALPQPVDQQPVVKNSRGVCATSRDIMFYDIPARYSESEVISAIKNIGNIHRIRIKKHYKYQSVRAEINLFDEYESEFVREAWKVQLLIGNSEKKQIVLQARWFPGQSTVKSIKEKCKWKAYKIIRSSYYQDVARKNYSFEYGKMARFGKNLVFLAYFKDKDQLDAAKALDKGADDTWIIHGKSLGNQLMEISKRDSRSDLVSTTPRINGKAMPAKNKQATATSTIMDNLNTDEVVDVVNKYRKNLLDETPQNVASTSIKDYTLPEKVVDIVLDLRAEITKELSQDEKEDESWIDRCRSGYATLVADLKERKKKVDDVRMARDTIKNELEVVQKKVNENQKLLDKIRSEKEKEGKSNENVKQVSPIELHEYESINETCSKRLDETKVEKIHTPEYIKWRDEQRDNYRKALKVAQEELARKRLRKTQGDRVKEEEDLESDSDEDDANQVEVSIEEPHNKRGGKPGSRGRGRGGRRRLVRRK
ncbi:unnamed protein product [Rhizophagus irregularis]|nr:unnamed protein product [Rhizophagus irregularis]CAB5365817.1 unnamed protein product [Rhizophagus irregularis]